MGFDVNSTALDIILPIGISFYTFQTLSYTIDIYRKNIEPEQNILNFALFVSFFPQLVAGPIVRAGQFLPQLARERRITKERFSRGATLFVFGLFSKIVLADAFLSPIVDAVYSSENISAIDSLVAMLAFSGQIYFDFSGYTSCALGLAIILGFTLPENFKSPYAASGFSDFWERWHISLSSWLRDYLYISLGGNRKGRTRTLINLMITMLLGGLWHGAAWNYVAWGVLQGIYLLIEHTLLNRFPAFRTKMNCRWVRLLTFVLISLSWVPFRSENLDQTQSIFSGLGNYGDALVVSQWQVCVTLIIISLMLFWQNMTRSSNALSLYRSFPQWCKSLILSFSLIAIYIASKEDSRAFIYFQF
ncbi:MAG: MBOAT family protein [Pseudomonadales bacterium]|nr:MBOAT family protein [Pseudomonadales bacterium]